MTDKNENTRYTINLFEIIETLIGKAPWIVLVSIVSTFVAYFAYPYLTNKSYTSSGFFSILSSKTKWALVLYPIKSAFSARNFAI